MAKDKRGWTKADRARWDAEYARCRKKQKRGAKVCRTNAFRLIRRLQEDRRRDYRRKWKVRRAKYGRRDTHERVRLGVCDCEK